MSFVYFHIADNELHNLRGQPASPKPDAAITRQVHAVVMQCIIDCLL
jgi:hypothetical protein